jgi:membrane protein implicated in regulation of membrane protease activity
MLFSVVMLCVCVALAAAQAQNTDNKDKSAKKAKEATITKVDAKKGTVTVKMQNEGKEVDKTFKLAENIEYMDSTGRVAAAEIFTSGDQVLIVEAEGQITKMKKQEKSAATKRPASK